MAKKTGLESWMESRVKKLDWLDYGLVKLSVAAFALMLAKLWQPLLSLEWYWYAVIFIVAAAKPMLKTF
ncbi:MAG: hypothetical protein V1817_01720 [Candidatus Micrarchaeota archaeon]